MKWPLQITYRRVMPGTEIEEWIRDKAEKLDTFYNYILSCHVTVEVPHRHHRKGDAFHVRIGVRVPGGEVVVNREPSLGSEMRRLGEPATRKRLELEGPQKNLQLAIMTAFRTVERRPRILHAASVETSNCTKHDPKTQRRETPSAQ